MVEFNLSVQGGVARFTLTGRLDSSVAPQLSEQLKTLVGKQITQVVFMAVDLEYISSAGLRAIVFAKQKIGSGTDVLLVGAKPEIVDVVKMTGFDSFVKIVETFNG